VRFPEAALLGHLIVQASLVDQLHDQIELPVIGAGGKNLDHVGIVHDGRGAGFLLKTADFGRISA
jgi:hypothetical protein